MKPDSYKQCTRCIMDNQSDNTITFDDSGCCNYCTTALELKNKVYFPNSIGQEKLEKLLSALKTKNKDNKYDCIMGISGGLDSSYLAYLGSVKWNLRILAVHVDDGFNTEISERNIDRIGQFPNFDLHIIKPDPYQYNELIKAYIRAGVPNLAAPQDNVLFACIYKFMKESKINTFLSGANYALECILQRGNTHTAYDLTNLKAINNKFGHAKIDKLPLISSFSRDLNSYLLNIKTIRPLDLIDYNKNSAMQSLIDYCGFEYYGSKHLENELTKFIQQYWFYKKFNVDKRTSHLSSMIVSGQITREDALKQYAIDLYEDEDMENTISAVLKRLNMSREELDTIINSESKQHTDYPVSNYLKIHPYLYTFFKKIKK
ncbi:N-acetyl sugar amidotransferase [Paenalcaligenes sp. Me131]|uniref:N-acetyl sugar amidotransferase n=1 Tax=Paenalcaligenes sp. Me131 TaxID=3392636 RepID=UPI003D2E712F